MQISFSIIDDVLITHFEGDLDITSKVKIAESSQFSPPFRNTVFDLIETRYMDSSGLGTLVEIARQVQDSGKKVALASRNPVINKVMKITSLNRVLPMADSIEKAMDLLRDPQSP